jgi:hypothetical protein
MNILKDVQNNSRLSVLKKLLAKSNSEATKATKESNGK